MDFDTIRTRAATSVWDRPSASPSPETQSVNFSRIKRFVASFDLDEQEDSIRKELGIPPFTDYSHQQKVLQGCSVILVICRDYHGKYHKVWGNRLRKDLDRTKISFKSDEAEAERRLCEEMIIWNFGSHYLKQFVLYDCLQDKEHSKPGHPEFHGKPLLTLFAPTNIAFAAIPPKLKFYLFSSFGEHAQPGGYIHYERADEANPIKRRPYYHHPYTSMQYTISVPLLSSKLAYLLFGR
ncbi:LOW QUALITY PROTEIN: hypothetical protein I204_08171 [Kwoniella mangroviensis CBS 8886]|nr:LOW QUALITY PROTEIN: uncharacterized protein I203_04469 [Kwoniella mangroviensis CBS 8507]OCF66143.1 LOW QUALITY PROTEIN: hypothetical protein I203_04469 [Kwoniella mangroviensis CBS 8507]OCF71218.1 LOW QUALITY PROTEIN: hypothetical protein I204_08171 [Kwoniella mangroviensis CBS 8886]